MSYLKQRLVKIEKKLGNKKLYTLQELAAQMERGEYDSKPDPELQRLARKTLEG